MAVLPDAGTIDISQGVTFESWPSYTWQIDKTTNRITGYADGWQAVRQAVEIILNIERFRWQIYQPYTGMQWDGLLGQDPGYVASEVQRRINAALLMDDRVRGISNFSFSIDGADFTASLTVDTVYGAVPTTVEVTLT